MEGPDVGTSLTLKPAAEGGVISFLCALSTSTAIALAVTTCLASGDERLTNMGLMSSLPYCVSGVLGVRGASSSSEELPLYCEEEEGEPESTLEKELSRRIG